MRRHTLRVLGAALVGALLCACGSGSPPAPAEGGWDAVVAAAQEEGEVVVYSGFPPELNRAIEEGFEARYPEIEVNFLRATSGQIIQRVGVEDDTGNVLSDVVVLPIPGIYSRWAEQGSLSALRGPVVTGAQFERYRTDEDRAVIVAAQPYGFGWNPRSPIPPPRSYTDLGDPRFRGSLAMYDWAASEAALGTVAWVGETYGEDVLRAIAANRPRPYTSVVPLAQDMAAGVFSVSTTLTEAAQQDLPIELGFPERPLGVAYYAGIRASSPHPNAAQLLVDWAMTPEGQTAWAAHSGSVLPDVPTAAFSIDEMDLMDGRYFERGFQSEWRRKLTDIFGAPGG